MPHTAAARRPGLGRPTCHDLVASLQQAHEALSVGDPLDAGEALTRAYSSALDLYGRLNPMRTSVCAHLQGLLENCIMHIEHASREADASALDAALQLLSPVRSMLPSFID